MVINCDDSSIFELIMVYQFQLIHIIFWHMDGHKFCELLALSGCASSSMDCDYRVPSISIFRSGRRRRLINFRSLSVSFFPMWQRIARHAKMPFGREELTGWFFTSHRLHSESKLDKGCSNMEPLYAAHNSKHQHVYDLRWARRSAQYRFFNKVMCFKLSQK